MFTSTTIFKVLLIPQEVCLMVQRYECWKCHGIVTLQNEPATFKRSNIRKEVPAVNGLGNPNWATESCWFKCFVFSMPLMTRARLERNRRSSYRWLGEQWGVFLGRTTVAGGDVSYHITIYWEIKAWWMIITSASAAGFPHEDGRWKKHVSWL